jgi:hypothetical protein
MVGLELGHRVEGDMSGYHSAILRLSKLIGNVFPKVPNPANVPK